MSQFQAPKYPEVHVQLTEEDGTAFSVASKTRRALERAGHREAAAEYLRETLSGDYNRVLRTTLSFVDVN